MKTEQMIQRINKRVRELAAYHLPPEKPVIKLNQNENPFDWDRDIKEQIVNFFSERPWNRYPDFVPMRLKDALAQYTGVSSEGIIAGNGSNEILLVLLLALTQEGDSVYICQPTFTLYSLLAQGLGRVPSILYSNKDLSYDVDTILQGLSASPESVTILCSPNNPTGASLTEEHIRKILDNHRGFLILDQAYVEFGGYDAIPLLQSYPNLIITRTFSKAQSGAGLRLGYMLGTPQIVQHINKIKIPYNISFFTEYAGTVLITHAHKHRKIIESIQKQREKVYEFLHTQPFDTVYPSTANFICFRTAHKDALFQFLKSKGILIRDVSSYPLMDNCLRISIGSEEENDALMNAVSNFFEMVS